MSHMLEDLSSNPAVDTLQEKSHETSIQNNLEELQTPYVGILFETLEEARNYYENYGQQEGFWIRICFSSRTRRGMNAVTNRQFVCAHQGKYVHENKKHDVVEESDKIEMNQNNDKKKMGKKCSTIKCRCESSMRIVHDKWLENGKF